MAKVREPLGDKRFGIIRLDEQGTRVFMDHIRGSKHLTDKASAEGEAQRLALLGDDVYVVEIVAGFGRRMQTTNLPIVGE